MVRKKKGPPFVMLERRTLESQEWRKLSMAAKLIYIYIKANFNGSNNGEISFKYSESEFAPATTANALRELLTEGWVEKTKHGGMFRFYCLYKLTGKHDRIRYA